MSDHPSCSVIEDKQYHARIHQLKNGNPDMPTYKGNGIAYFLEIFAGLFEDATNKLQMGETNLTEAMQGITKLINDNKDKQLKEDNTILQWDISNAEGKKGEDLTKAENQIQLDQAKYKVDDSKYQSLIQEMSPVTTTDTDLTTSISQNNNTINQMAFFVIAIVKSLAEQLIRLT